MLFIAPYFPHPKRGTEAAPNYPDCRIVPAAFELTSDMKK
jgi:hypothetical protein